MNDLYQLPQFNFKSKKNKKKKKDSIAVLGLAVLLASVFGFLAGMGPSLYFYFQVQDYLEKAEIAPIVLETEEGVEEYTPAVPQEKVVVEVAEKASPAVVSIIVSKNVPLTEDNYINPFKEFEEFFGPVPDDFQLPEYRQEETEKREIGGGSGFIVSEDGMILTNKHVILEEEADYAVFTNDGRSFSASVLARDPFKDLAILKIEQDKEIDETGEPSLESFPVLKMGDSDTLKIGQTVVAIGNALGEFRNTVSVGVVSGLGRQITATGGEFVTTLKDVIQTDAAINKGNSGGPLLNLRGEVVGINTAIASGAQSIGFSIPINDAKRAVSQVKEKGEIVYAFMGVRYLVVNKEIQEENKLPIDYGAWIQRGDQGEPAVLPDSAAEKAGIKEGDIILELDGKQVTEKETLSDIILDYDPGDAVDLKVLRAGKEITLKIILGKKSG
jgi:serine protease Do